MICPAKPDHRQHPRVPVAKVVENLGSRGKPDVLTTSATSIPRPAMTLIELIVVLVILALLITTVTVSIAPQIRRQRILHAADTIATADRIARTWARSAAAPVWVAIRRSATGPSTILVDDGQTRRRRFQIDDSIDLPNRQIPFDDHGRSPDYNVPLQSGSFRRTIAVTGISGQTRILAGDRSMPR